MVLIGRLLLCGYNCMVVNILSLVLVLSLLGCSSGGYQVTDNFENPYSKNLYKKLDSVVTTSRYDEQASNVKIAESARSISDSLQELAKIQRSVNNLKKIKEDPNLIKADVDVVTSVDWTGPIDTLLKKIAKSSSLKYRSLGNPPAVPILVSVNKNNITVSDLIRDIAYQVQNQASVALTKDRVIELRYSS